MNNLFFMTNIGLLFFSTLNRIFSPFFLFIRLKYLILSRNYYSLCQIMYRFRLYLHRHKHLFIYDLVCTFASEITISFNHLKLYKYGEFQ